MLNDISLFGKASETFHVTGSNPRQIVSIYNKEERTHAQTFVC